MKYPGLSKIDQSEDSSKGRMPYSGFVAINASGRCAISDSKTKLLVVNGRHPVRVPSHPALNHIAK
jgi:hypothetical protein